MAAILVASAAIAQNLPRLLGQEVPDCGLPHGAGKFPAYDGTTDMSGGIRAVVTRRHTPAPGFTAKPRVSRASWPWRTFPSPALAVCGQMVRPGMSGCW